MNMPNSKLYRVLVLAAIFCIALALLSCGISGEGIQTANVEDVEVTRPYMHKVIRGATLTEYGR